MSLFEDASLITTPNAYKAGKLYSIKPSNGDGDLDVVRATTATRVNSAGLIETVANNVPRLDYTNGSCPSVLVEPQRTNLVFPSETATTQTRTVTAVSHTLSFYGTGTVVLSGVGSGTLVGTGANNRVTLTFTPTAGSLTLTVTGSVTKWQLEAGSNATSYIPTVASAVTRNADVISKTGIADLIGQTEGTMFVEFNNGKIDGNQYILGINTDVENRIIIFKQVNNTIQGQVRKNGPVTATFSSSALIQNQDYKVAISYQENNVNFYVNGFLIGTDTSTEIPACSNFTLDDGGGGRYFYRPLKSILLFKTALTEQECINLTTL